MAAAVQAEAVFVSSVTSYTRGDLYTGGGTLLSGYGDASVALGQPSPTVAGGGGYPPSVLTPFNAHYEESALAAFGRTGSVTFQFPKTMSVVSGPMIGIFSNAGFSDYAYPDGLVGTTFTQGEYSYERSAIVEVGADVNNMKSLGRVQIDMPANYYANIGSPYAAVAPANAILANFSKPYVGSAADFTNMTLARVLTQLGGSAGGTWLAIPANLGLSTINYIRFSDPLWIDSQGNTSPTAHSIYYSETTVLKYADLFLNGVVAIPEPAGLSLLVLGGLSLLRRRH